MLQLEPVRIFSIQERRSQKGYDLFAKAECRISSGQVKDSKKTEATVWIPRCNHLSRQVCNGFLRKICATRVHVVDT